ncbi:MAG: hypothetical protein NWR72_10365, partial [Bacteroidia bacterium]|nr:hypothetical protein [Bacteroidia bacterium]
IRPNTMQRTLLSFCLLFPLLLSAQESRVGLTIRADYGNYTMPEIDLNDFYRGYNAYYGSNMKVPFDTLSPTVFSHPNYGLGVRASIGDNVGLATGLFITRGNSRFSQQATFQNNIITQTDFDVTDWTCQIDVGVHLFHFLYLQGHMAGHFRNTQMDLGYFYQDGSYSIGNEYDILGVYTASTTTIDFGASAMIRVWKVIIPVSISFPSNMLSDGGLITLTDFDASRVRWTDLPRDYATWANDPANLDLDTGFVRAQSLQSVRINIGLEIYLHSVTD